MAKWKRVLQVTGQGVDSLNRRISKRYGKSPYIIQPYLSYGTREKLNVRGRVMTDRGIGGAQEDDSAWRNFRNTVKRLWTTEVPDARVKLSFQDSMCEIRSNRDGYLEDELKLDKLLEREGDNIYEIELELLEPKRNPDEPQRSLAPVLVPPDGAEFGIISDMDDTVLQTRATRLLSMAKKTLFGNAHTRLPFEGVEAFYKGLNRDLNPLFYVSSSPWNLYDFLVEFLETNDIPLGPLILRDWGLSGDGLPTDHGGHKGAAIQNIMNTYPNLPFILIGDSGQEDPEIYRDVVHDYPDRILAVYIRDVHRGDKRTAKIEALAKEVEAAGSTLLLTDDTPTAARHAAERGWVPKDTVAETVEAKQEDESLPAI